MCQGREGENLEILHLPPPPGRAAPIAPLPCGRSISRVNDATALHSGRQHTGQISPRTHSLRTKSVCLVRPAHWRYENDIPGRPRYQVSLVHLWIIHRVRLGAWVSILNADQGRLDSRFVGITMSVWLGFHQSISQAHIHYSTPWILGSDKILWI